MKIELTDEQVKAWENGEDIVITSPKKKNHEVEYENGCWFLDTHNITDDSNGKVTSFKTHGRYRKTKENAEFSHKRNQQSNRLEAKVEELQGQLGVGDYEICFDNTDRWVGIGQSNTIGSISMKRETAIEICRLLNEGLWSMDEIL